MMRFAAGWFVALLWLLPAPGLVSAEKGGGDRAPILAGQWYPGSAKRLKAVLQEYLDKAPEAKDGARAALVALIAPHAGWIYSGQVAACAYKAAQGADFDAVVLIGPSHRFRFDGVSVYDRGGYRTPLGTMPPDRSLAAALRRADPDIRHLPEAHAMEHSLEIQIPFLQTVLPRAKLVPLVMGDQDFATCRRLADALAETLAGKRALIVASSDLSHFHSYDEAVDIDRRLLERVAAFDPEGLARDLAEGRCEACGGGPMITAMLAARKLGAGRAEVLRYANSGDTAGDRKRVVGYMAAAFFRTEDK